LERRAWFNGLQFDPDSGTYAARIGIDEVRLNRADLEIDFEEYVSGDLAAARRLSLGDIPLPTSAIPAGSELVVQLPTLGSGVGRQVRLFDRDGLLLDASDRMWTVEGWQLTINVPGSPPTVAGRNYAKAVDLLERLRISDDVEESYKQWLKDGLEERVIDDPLTGLPALQALLGGACGELCVLDPYFGWDLADWSVLAAVQVPIRVLSGHGYYDRKTGRLQKEKVTPIPPGTASTAPYIKAKSWRGPQPWHDRFYLWDGRGLVVGTSPSGLGKRLARIDRLTSTEAEGWRHLFNSWWSSPQAVDI
jgi:hypothetical protein